jgi:PAS domain S-box-containing protein
MYIPNIVTRISVIKLTLVLALFCMLFSLVIYLVASFIIVGSIRGFEIFMSLLIPAIVSPPVCIVLLNVARSLCRAQEEILKAQMELENKVADRTQELRIANKKLEEEIQEKRRAEQNLIEITAMQRTLLANLSVGVIIVDPVTSKIELVNDYAAAMFGVEKEHILGQRCHTFICPAAEGACPVRDLGQEVDNSEREMVCADGSRKPILKSVNRIQIQNQEKLLECFVDITNRKRGEEEREKLILELQEALKKVKQLSGLLPVCASCKNIRNDKGYWEQIEAYIQDHSEADFSHTICPDCAKRLYPQLYKKE